MTCHGCPALGAVLDGVNELIRLGHSVPPTGAARARIILATHGWATARGALLDPDRLKVLARAAIEL